MDNDFFSGFEPMPNTNLSTNISSLEDGDTLDIRGDITDLTGHEDPIIEPPVTEEEEEEVISKNNDTEPSAPEDEEEEEEEDDEDITTQTPSKKKQSKKQLAVDDEEGLDKDDEEAISEFLQVQLYERYGIDFDEEADDNFKSVDDVVGFIDEAIQVGSVPAFANDEVSHIDKYVRDGGDLSHYMGTVYGDLDLDNVNIDEEKVQVSLIRQDLKNQGMSEKRITRKIERIEDTGTLVEEAEDALDSLKEYKTLQQETLLVNQEKAKENAEQANLKFVQNVQDELKGMSSILDVPLTEKDKKDVLTYIFKPDQNGRTQYQNDYASSQKNLIASAYFTMKGDKLMTKVEKKAKSNAAKKLKTKLASKGKRGKDQSSISGNTLDAWGAISKQLRK